MPILARILLLVVVGCISVACQSEKEGVEIICKGMPEDRQGELDPAIRAKAFSDYMAEELSNSTARELFKAMADKSPGDRGRDLADAAKRLGIARCRTASVFEISALLDDLGKAHAVFFEAFRAEFSREPKMLAALDRNCAGLEFLTIPFGLGRDTAESEIKLILGEVQACFSRLNQTATNLGVKARYQRLEPTTVLSKAAEAHAGMIAHAEGL